MGVLSDCGIGVDLINQTGIFIFAAFKNERFRCVHILWAEHGPIGRERAIAILQYARNHIIFDVADDLIHQLCTFAEHTDGIEERERCHNQIGRLFIADGKILRILEISGKTIDRAGIKDEVACENRVQHADSVDGRCIEHAAVDFFVVFVRMQIGIGNVRAQTAGHNIDLIFAGRFQHLVDKTVQIFGKHDRRKAPVVAPAIDAVCAIGQVNGCFDIIKIIFPISVSGNAGTVCRHPVIAEFYIFIKRSNGVIQLIVICCEIAGQHTASVFEQQIFQIVFDDLQHIGIKTVNL